MAIIHYPENVVCSGDHRCGIHNVSLAQHEVGDDAACASLTQAEVRGILKCGRCGDEGWSYLMTGMVEQLFRR